MYNCIRSVQMCSLTPPSSTGIQNRVLGDAAGERSLPNLNFSFLDTDSQNNSKIMQLELKKARLETQINLSKTQTMLAEMELHLVEIEIRQELWRNKSEAQVHPPAKCQTGRPYKQLLVRKPIRPMVRPRYKRPKSYTQDKHHETTHDVNVEEKEQLAAGSHPVDHQSHHQQIGECSLTKQGEVLFDDQRSQKVNASEIDAQKRGEKQYISRSDADQCHLDVARGEFRSTTVPEDDANRIDIQDAALVAASRDDTDVRCGSRSEKITENTNNKANIETEIVQTDNITGKEEDVSQCESNKGQKSNDSKEKTIMKYKLHTLGKTASSDTCCNKDQEAENNNNDMLKTNTRSKKSEKKSIPLYEHVSKKHTAVKQNIDIKNNSKKTGSSTVVKIPIRVRLLNDSIALEVNNNDVNRQNSEREDAVDTTISLITDRESALSANLTSSESSAANSKNSSEGTETGVVGNITQKVLSTCKNVFHEEQNTNKKYSIENKRSKTRNVEGKENTSNVSKERHRSHGSKTKSSKQDKKHGSKGNTTSTSNNVNSNKDQEKNNNNDKHERKSDTSSDKSRKDKKSHRYQKDENVPNKSNAKNNVNQCQMELNLSKDKDCKKIKSKSSSVEKTTETQGSSGTEGAHNINSFRNKTTKSYDNYFLERETDAFDKHETKSDKSNDKNRKSRKSHRHQKDENVTSKSNTKNNGKQCQMQLDVSKDEDCQKIKSKPSSVEKTTGTQRSSRTEGANNINSFGNKRTESYDNYFLERETDAFDKHETKSDKSNDNKSNILGKTQELQDVRNNLRMNINNSSVSSVASLVHEEIIETISTRTKYTKTF